MTKKNKFKVIEANYVKIAEFNEKQQTLLELYRHLSMFKKGRILGEMLYILAHKNN